MPILKVCTHALCNFIVKRESCVTSLSAEAEFTHGTTLAVEQEVAHVEAEGATDISTAVGQGAGQTATVE